MRIYVCKVCGHIEFDVVPDKCPVCQAPKTAFEEKADAIKKPANPGQLTEGDKKHIPQIVVAKQCGLIPGGSCYDVHAKVGEIEHVMEPKHYIMYVDFYLNKKFLARTQFMPEGCHPAACLHLKAASGTVTVIENCNIHGMWMGEAKL